MAEDPTTGGELAGTVAESSAPPAPSSASPTATAPARDVSAALEGSRSREAPARLRELLAVAGVVALADVTIYHGHGFAGYAVLFLAAPLLLLLGAPRPRVSAAAGVVGLMILVVAGRLAWCGTGLLTAAGFWLLAAFAAAVAGLKPYVLDVLVYACQSVVAGIVALLGYTRIPFAPASKSGRTAWPEWLMPSAALLGFGTLFVLANPDLASLVSERLEEAFRWAQRQLLLLFPGWQRVLFWIAAAWLAAGLLRPVLRKSVLARFTKQDSASAATSAATPLYGAYRNTLLTVIVLFAVYLVFEFKTLWFREFPEGFYYSGYAHEGAAWLTAALALATAVLSFIFRPSVFRDPRLPRLRRLAWIWSAENMLLAVAVYNRLFIYIGFNGMTRMRTVGLLGISAVAVGFLLVVRKITAGHDFVWLLRRHLWTLAVAVYLFAVMPVDMIVHTYNVRRILAGDPAPSVQISVHPIDSAGILVLPPLLDCDDSIIREGVRAMLAERALEAKAASRKRRQAGWTSFQLADRLLLDRLEEIRGRWEQYADAEKRADALARFDDYAYQWY